MTQHPDKETLIGFLKNVSLFLKADAEVLSHLATKTVFASFKKEETVIRKGDVGHTMYLIFSGKLKVHEGEHQVAELKKGGFFGELSLLDSEPRSMSVTALEESLLGNINRDDFYEALKKSPEMTKDIIAALNNRLRNQNDVLISEFKNEEKKLKELVVIRTSELEQKNIQLELAMRDLRRSQQQLVQSEKLASLGQLTAGIAHEIQNPLNFVNNFSQLSSELIDEIKEMNSEEERNEILSDLKINLDKISHHGKRADSIVKNMLEHSRTGTGEKQPTNINQLCDEYFTLSYQGARANNADFNCELKKEFAAELPKAAIIQQDVSRVLINLFNNAFYTVKEKSAKSTDKSYRPVVSLITQFRNTSLTISIRDNGTGIATQLKEKIFEPFFTTKPSGQGTGLGLSLSYDIIKSHGGEITVESAEGEGSEFTIILPIS